MTNFMMTLTNNKECVSFSISVNSVQMTNNGGLWCMCFTSCFKYCLPPFSNYCCCHGYLVTLDGTGVLSVPFRMFSWDTQSDTQSQQDVCCNASHCPIHFHPTWKWKKRFIVHSSNFGRKQMREQIELEARRVTTYHRWERVCTNPSSF